MHEIQVNFFSSSPELKRVLEPLSSFYVPGEIERKNGALNMIVAKTEKPDILFSHSAFIRTHVVPEIFRRTEKISAGDVVELLQVSVSAYGKIKEEEMLLFWLCTVLGQENFQAAGNLSLVEKRKIKAGELFDGILNIAVTKAEMGVGNVADFFKTKGCYIGPVILELYEQRDFESYVKLCQKLLRRGISEGSIDFRNSRWDALSPAVKKYGMGTVMGLVVDFICSAPLSTRLPRTKFSLAGDFLAAFFAGISHISAQTAKPEEFAAEIKKFFQPAQNLLWDADKEGLFFEEEVNKGVSYLTPEKNREINSPEEMERFCSVKREELAGRETGS